MTMGQSQDVKLTVQELFQDTIALEEELQLLEFALKFVETRSELVVKAVMMEILFL